MFCFHGLLAAFWGTCGCCTHPPCRATLYWVAPLLNWCVILFQTLSFPWVCSFLTSPSQFCLSVCYKIVLTVGLHNDPHLLLALTSSKFPEDLSEKGCCHCLVAPSFCISSNSQFLISLVIEMAMNTSYVPLAVKTGMGHDFMPNNHGISKQLLTWKYRLWITWNAKHWSISSLSKDLHVCRSQSWGKVVVWPSHQFEFSCVFLINNSMLLQRNLFVIGLCAQARIAFWHQHEETLTWSDLAQSCHWYQDLKALMVLALHLSKILGYILCMLLFSLFCYSKSKGDDDLSDFVPG